MAKNILITGTTGGLGTAVAKKFISEGNTIFGSITPGKSTPDDGVNYFEADLTSLDSVSALFGKLSDKSLEAGVFLVGGFGMGNLENTTKEDIQKQLDLNFLTAFYCCQNLYPLLTKNGGGKIVLIGAKPALEGGGAETLAYTIAKTTVIKLAEIINESGKEDNIQASVVVPSIIDTPTNRKSMPEANFSDWVTPEAIAESIHFLVSEKGNPLRDTVLKLYGNS